jgi:hypothetical protein
LESLLVQGILVVLLLVALGWTFVLAPRRLRSAPLFSEPRHVKPSPTSIPTPVPQEASLELLRSLERMEADLGEMRAEVERMKTNLTEAPESRARKQ